MITATGLSRAFTARTGLIEEVRGVGLHVDAGEIVGFLGPSGAGKTTTLRIDALPEACSTSGAGLVTRSASTHRTKGR